MNRDFENPLGKVAYQAPCHLRHQNIGFRARDLLKLTGAEVTLVDACSGVDGTWGMQARFHEASMQGAQAMLERIREAQPDHIATDCPLSALRILPASLFSAHLPVSPVTGTIRRLAALAYLLLPQPGRVVVQAPGEAVHDTVMDDQQFVAHAAQQVTVMGDDHQRTAVADQCHAQRLAHLQVQVVGGLVQ